MPAPDLSALSTAFGVLGAPVFGRMVTEWDLRADGIQVRTNVNTPQFLTKLSAVGKPRPYREQDDFGNGVAFTDRTLIAYQSKKDYTFNPENFRNTYLAGLNPNSPEYLDAAVAQVIKEYLDALMTDTLYLGVRNAGGTSAVDLGDGWGTKIAAEITATNLTPIVTGAITSSNAVAKVKLVARGVEPALKQKGFTLYCSFDVFEKWCDNYETLNAYQYKPDLKGDYPIQGSRGFLKPVFWMGTSQRLIATVKDNLVFGTDIERVTLNPTPHLDIIQIRQKMPIGMEIQDLEVLTVNDQA